MEVVWGLLLAVSIIAELLWRRRQHNRLTAERRFLRGDWYQ